MKKTKLLIPALSVASVGAIVAPIVTSCNKSDAIGLTEVTGQAGYYSTGTTLHDYKSGSTYKYTGCKMQESATLCVVMTGTVTESEGKILKVTGITINGTKCTVKEQKVSTVITGYYCDLPSGLKAGDALTIEVTYGEAGSQYATVIAIAAE